MLWFILILYDIPGDLKLKIVRYEECSRGGGITPGENTFQGGFKGSLIIAIYWENKLRAPEEVPEASACEGVHATHYITG